MEAGGPILPILAPTVGHGSPDGACHRNGGTWQALTMEQGSRVRGLGEMGDGQFNEEAEKKEDNYVAK